jgi:hypothetical protein
MSTDHKITRTQAAALALIAAAREMFPDLSIVVSAMDKQTIATRFSNDCADVGALMLAGMATTLEDNIKRGTMHVHGFAGDNDMPEVQTNQALHH